MEIIQSHDIIEQPHHGIRTVDRPLIDLEDSSVFIAHTYFSDEGYSVPLLLKYTQKEKVWEKRLYNPNKEYNIVIEDYIYGKDNYIYLVGYCNYINSGQIISVLIKLDSQGEVLWAKTINTESIIMHYQIDVHPNGNLHIAGLLFEITNQSWEPFLSIWSRDGLLEHFCIIPNIAPERHTPHIQQLITSSGVNVLAYVRNDQVEMMTDMSQEYCKRIRFPHFFQNINIRSNRHNKIALLAVTKQTSEIKGGDIILIIMNDQLELIKSTKLEFGDRYTTPYLLDMTDEHVWIHGLNCGRRYITQIHMETNEQYVLWMDKQFIYMYDGIVRNEVLIFDASISNRNERKRSLLWMPLDQFKPVSDEYITKYNPIINIRQFQTGQETFHSTFLDIKTK